MVINVVTFLFSWPEKIIIHLSSVLKKNHYDESWKKFVVDIKFTHVKIFHINTIHNFRPCQNKSVKKNMLIASLSNSKRPIHCMWLLKSHLLNETWTWDWWQFVTPPSLLCFGYENNWWWSKCQNIWEPHCEIE